MLNQAIAKIDQEIESKKGNKYIKAIGEYLKGHLREHEEDAEKILVESKSIEKSIGAMKQEASKNKVGNMAMISDEEGYKIVLKYFGIKLVGKITVPDKKPEVKSAFDVSLDDFL